MCWTKFEEKALCLLILFKISLEHVCFFFLVDSKTLCIQFLYIDWIFIKYIEFIFIQFCLNHKQIFKMERFQPYLFIWQFHFFQISFCHTRRDVGELIWSKTFHFKNILMFQRKLGKDITSQFRIFISEFDIFVVFLYLIYFLTSSYKCVYTLMLPWSLLKLLIFFLICYIVTLFSTAECGTALYVKIIQFLLWNIIKKTNNVHMIVMFG